jgi:Protein of unknown function (DUF3768)
MLLLLVMLLLLAGCRYNPKRFGAFQIDGNQLFRKIGYCAPDMDGGSEGPSDPKATTRVLTITLASEY